MFYFLLFAAVMLILKVFAIVVVSYGGIFTALGVILACYLIARHIHATDSKTG